MDTITAHQVAQAAGDFQHERTGHEPPAVTVVLSGETLATNLHGALSPGEQALAKSAAGAAKTQEFHRQLIANSAESLREHPPVAETSSAGAHQVASPEATSRLDSCGSHPWN